MTFHISEMMGRDTVITTVYFVLFV
jgi:hypothetical protein